MDHTRHFDDVVFRISALAPPHSPALPLRALQLLTFRTTWIIKATIKRRDRVKRLAVPDPLLRDHLQGEVLRIEVAAV